MRQRRFVAVFVALAAALVVLAASSAWHSPPAAAAPLSLGNASFEDFAEFCPKTDDAKRPSKKKVNKTPKKKAKKTRKNAERSPSAKRRRGAKRRSPARRTARPAMPDPALIARGQDLFEDEVVFGQRPTSDPAHFAEQLSCADCHLGPAFTDGQDHLVPTRDRKLVPRQTQPLFDIARAPRRSSREAPTGGFAWDGRYLCAEAATQGAISNPTEMNSTRLATSDELKALMAFMSSLSAPEAQPAVDYDPGLARKGEELFTRERPASDRLGGEFGEQTRMSCATCHSGLARTDDRFHRNRAPNGDPLIDPGRIDPDGNDRGKPLPALVFGALEKNPVGLSKGQVTGFRTPALIGLRFTAPYFHSAILPGVGCGTSARLPREGLRCVLEHYNQRFGFRFDAGEKRALIEFLMSL